ncbi:MAG: hypothetical protein ACLR2G_05210 [Phascolarctobacterium faecium]
MQNGDSLVTTIIKSGISDDTKSPVETQAAAAGFTTAARTCWYSGITSMSKVTSARQCDLGASGGSMRYDTGSHADVKAITSLWVWANSCQQCAGDLRALCGIWLWRLSQLPRQRRARRWQD